MYLTKTIELDPTALTVLLKQVLKLDDSFNFNFLVHTVGNQRDECTVFKCIQITGTEELKI
jgi:hypothetical protein